MPPELGCRRALLLQGPPGPFFSRLAGELGAAGVQVDKINFNGGDELFYPDGIAFREDMDAWPSFFERVVEERGIDALLLFGDCRPIHKVAVERARARGVAIWVFEEGYLRPDYITLERDGVNGFSRLPRDPGFYEQQAAALPEPPHAQPVGQSFFRHAYYSTRYALATSRSASRFARYAHHRALSPWMHAAGWLRGGIKKSKFAREEGPLAARFEGEWSGRYFLVPLQVHADYQIIEHSPFGDIDEVIELVMGSFAQHAPDDTILVLKHHPMDRGYRDYTHMIRARAETLGLGPRVYAIHDLHLPTLLKQARGVITVNSTVGLSAVHHGTPVKLLGTAIYDLSGLTDQAPLAEFWAAPTPPNPALYRAFTKYLRWTTQHNGNFYRPLHSHGTGVRWTPSPRLQEQAHASGSSA
ncbi:capsule biosynthesis protein [Haliangium sp.]|uniref:capsule biosynthesis protein n=1 Tax=Haliangium sp. TaxID=2663208 RepID=UPI003D0A8B29